MAKEENAGTGGGDELSALLNNAAAVRAVSTAVEGTIGPKGLDCLLVDRFGGVTVTNDGVSILTLMEAAHPAARMVINIAKSQEDEVGDGTTTATIIAGALVEEAVNQALKGVPVPRLLDGIRLAGEEALSFLRQSARPVRGVSDPLLHRVALISGRGHKDIAGLICRGAELIGEEKLRDPAFKFAENILSQEGAENEVVSGLVLDRERYNRQMPSRVDQPVVLVMDDALEPEKVEDEALATEAGFARYLALEEEFKANLQKLAQAGIKAVFVDRGVHDLAEEILTDAGVMVVARVPHRDLIRIAEHTGARLLKKTSLRRPAEDLVRLCGQAGQIYEDERQKQVRILGGKGLPAVTIIVGAATTEVVDERRRIAKDAAAAVQQAIRGGVVPGGGAAELAAGRAAATARTKTQGMAAFGVQVVEEALKRPLAQIIANAGFNPLEKVADAAVAQVASGSDALAIDCDSGQVTDMWQAGVVDPVQVKIHAVKAALEIAEAILRINAIIRRKEDSPAGAEPPMHKV